MKNETCAGGVMFKRTDGGLRIALILDPYGKWALPKGHVEPGERVIDAARRETAEETGIDRLTTTALLGWVEYGFKDKRSPKGGAVRKRVHYFLFEAPADAVGTPQREERIREVRWFAYDEAVEAASYPTVRIILERAKPHLDAVLLRAGPFSDAR